MANTPYPIRGLGDWWNELRLYINDRPTETKIVEDLTDPESDIGEVLDATFATKNHTHADPPTTIVDAKGDLLAGSAPGTLTRVPVGGSGKILTADSTAVPGMKWSTSGYLEGTGTPEGVVAAPVGSRYVDLAATNGAVEWIKTTGTGSTGWRVVYGDTGDRAIMTWDAAGTISGTNYFNAGLAPLSGQAGGLYVRRRGDRVTLRMVNLSFTAAGSTLSGLPAGFQMITNGGTYPFAASGNVIRAASRPGYTYLTGTSTGQSFGPAGGSVVEYPTTDPWPTLLPGTPT